MSVEPIGCHLYIAVTPTLRSVRLHICVIFFTFLAGGVVSPFQYLFVDVCFYSRFVRQNC
jgi:hypothetical protein